MDFATCEMRAAKSCLPSVLPKVGSCSGLQAKARFAFSCLKQACCLHLSSVVFYWVPYARGKRVQGHDHTKVFPTSVVLGVRTAGRGFHWSAPDVHWRAPAGGLMGSWNSHRDSQSPSASATASWQWWGAPQPLKHRPTAQPGESLPPIENKKIQAQNHFNSSLQNGDIKMSWCQEFPPFLSPAQSSCPHITLLSKLLP